MFTSTYTVTAADVFIGPPEEGPALTIRAFAVQAISGVHARIIVRGGGYVPMLTEPGPRDGAMVWGSGVAVPGVGTRVQLSGLPGWWYLAGNAAPVPVCDHCLSAPADRTDLCAPCLEEETGLTDDHCVYCGARAEEHTGGKHCGGMWDLSSPNVFEACDGDRPMRINDHGELDCGCDRGARCTWRRAA